jgi:hypothetical protein
MVTLFVTGGMVTLWVVGDPVRGEHQTVRGDGTSVPYFMSVGIISDKPHGNASKALATRSFYSRQIVLAG